MITNARRIWNRLSGGPRRRLPACGEHFKVDQPHVDAQHEAIFQIATEIADAWREQGPVSRVKALTGKLDNVLKAHFQYEEAELAQLGDPCFQEHKAEHDAMLEELHRIHGRLDAVQSSADPITPTFILHNFVQGLILGHINGKDMDYSTLARGTAV
jgi:hemerythrin